MGFERSLAAHSEECNRAALLISGEFFFFALTETLSCVLSHLATLPNNLLNNLENFFAVTAEPIATSMTVSHGAAPSRRISRSAFGLNLELVRSWQWLRMASRITCSRDGHGHCRSHNKQL